MDIEQQLRAALAPRAPRPGFDERVMARLKVGKPAPARRGWRIAAALAATVFAVAFAVHWQLVQQRQRHAGEQLMLALQITSTELNQVQQKLVHVETTQPQENGS
jgi:hypothetical protein